VNREKADPLGEKPSRNNSCYIRGAG
jgi:hypothetical protein